MKIADPVSDRSFFRNYTFCKHGPLSTHLGHPAPRNLLPKQSPADARQALETRAIVDCGV